jgi:hypothetical protein
LSFSLIKYNLNYLQRHYSSDGSSDNKDISLDEQVVPMNDISIFGSMLQSDGRIDENASNEIRAG